MATFKCMKDAHYPTVIVAESANVLEYFTLTSPTYLPRHDDGSSDAINVPGGFPFGSQNFSSIFVRLNSLVGNTQ